MIDWNEDRSEKILRYFSATALVIIALGMAFLGSIIIWAIIVGLMNVGWFWTLIILFLLFLFSSAVFIVANNPKFDNWI